MRIPIENGNGKKRAGLNRIGRFVLAAALLSAAGMGAQSPPLETAASSPSSVVQKTLAAHGSRWTSGSIADWIAEGKLTFFGMDGPKATFDMSLLRKGALQVQRVIKQPPGNLKQGSDGSGSWESIAGFYAPASQGRVLHFIESQTVRSPQRLFNHHAEGLSLNDLGSTGTARVIEAEDRQGRKTRYHVDLETSIINRLEFVVGEARDPFSGKQQPINDSYVFSDYRTVDGVLTPFKIERFTDEMKIEEMVFSSVRYNEGLRDLDFRR